MRPLAFTLVLFLAACAQQTTQPSGPAAPENTQEERLAAADCLGLRAAMKEALDAQRKATAQPRSGDVEPESERPEGIASLLIPLPLGTIGRAVASGLDSEPSEETDDPEARYRRAHETYEKTGCAPKVPYGEY